ncbi:probable chitinase 10 isoform X3 [Zophobas morio]|uniref:probable chitinase 10 isoform X3 n=1 Tax=Zophobas morio TaxID=2755281 RepID=UPI0030828B70
MRLILLTILFSLGVSATEKEIARFPFDHHSTKYCPENQYYNQVSQTCQLLVLTYDDGICTTGNVRGKTRRSSNVCISCTLSKKDSYVPALLSAQVSTTCEELILKYDFSDQTRTPLPWTTTFPSTMSSTLGYNDIRCYGHDGEYYPDIACDRFVYCELGWGREFSCPTGLYFNEKESKCGPFSESFCAGDPRCNPDGTPDLLPDLTDCTKYVECYGGYSYSMSCRDGLWFSADQKTCVPPEESGCIASTTVPSTSKLPDHDPRCIGNQGSLVPHPQSCDKFLECHQSRTFERTCPSGLHFAGDNGRCVSPKISTCVSK